MVRTKDQVGIKVGGKSSKVSAKSSRQTESFANDKGKFTHGGGNAYCPRDTPSWQKEITKFFGQPSTLKVRNSDSSAQPSSSSQKDVNDKDMDEFDDVPTENKLEDKENNVPKNVQNDNTGSYPEINKENEQNDEGIHDDAKK